MTTTVSLTTTQIAQIVQSNDAAKAAVLSAYIADNSLSLNISDLDSITLAETSVSVAIGSTTTVAVTATGDSAVTVTSSDEAITTAAYADGVLTVSGVAAGSATLTLAKGEESAVVSVTSAV